MAHLILTKEAVIRMAAEMGADGDDAEYLASEQSAYAEEIEEANRRGYDGEDVDAIVADIIGRGK